VTEIDAVYDKEVEVVDQMSSDLEDLDKDVRMLVGWDNWSAIVVGERRIAHRRSRGVCGCGDTDGVTSNRGSSSDVGGGGHGCGRGERGRGRDNEAGRMSGRGRGGKVIGRGRGGEADTGDLLLHPTRKIPFPSVNTEEGRKNGFQMM